MDGSFNRFLMTSRFSVTSCQTVPLCATSALVVVTYIYLATDKVERSKKVATIHPLATC